MNTRPPAVAGSFYPADSKELKNQIQDYLKEARGDFLPPKAFIAPHAGTIYSGPVAATAYASLVPLRDQIKKVVLLGPAHHVGFEGIAASTADFFQTPLGKIPLDRASVKKIFNLPDVIEFDEAHREEHSLELHLPFLQGTLGNFSLMPLVVGMSEPEDVAQVLDALWNGKETLVVVSSDLSHYHPYKEAQAIDRDCAQKIEKADWKELGSDQACGFFPVRGLLKLAQKKVPENTYSRFAQFG